MSTRSKFDNKLMELKEKLLEMEGLAEAAIKIRLVHLLTMILRKLTWLLIVIVKLIP